MPEQRFRASTSSSAKGHTAARSEAGTEQAEAEQRQRGRLRNLVLSESIGYRLYLRRITQSARNNDRIRDQELGAGTAEDGVRSAQGRLERVIEESAQHAGARIADRIPVLRIIAGQRVVFRDTLNPLRDVDVVTTRTRAVFPESDLAEAEIAGIVETLVDPDVVAEVVVSLTFDLDEVDQGLTGQVERPSRLGEVDTDVDDNVVRQRGVDELEALVFLRVGSGQRRKLLDGAGKGGCRLSG